MRSGSLQIGPVGRVTILSGVVGFFMGLVLLPSLHDAVESAQVLAGIVTYPVDNPFYVCQLKLWNLLSQISAALLMAGFSEQTICLIVSGLLGMLSYQGLALCVFALSRDAAVSTVAPLVIHLSVATNLGITYPIILMGSHYTYGVLGLSYVFLVVALFGIGNWTLGAFLLGLAPAVHPSLGILSCVLVAICCLWETGNLRAMPRRLFGWFLAGLAVTIISFSLQLWWMKDLPEIGADMSSQYLQGFIKNWSGHNVPVQFFSTGFIVVAASTALCLLYLHLCPREVQPSSLFLLRFFLVSGLFGGLFAALSWLPTQTFPNWFLALMPQRILNLNILAFVGLLIGLLARYAGRFTVLAFATALLYCSSVWARFDAATWKIGITILLGVMTATLLFYTLGRRKIGLGFISKTGLARRLAATLLVALCFLAVGIKLNNLWNLRHLRDIDEEDLGPLVAEARKGKGLLLTSAIANVTASNSTPVAARLPDR